MIGGLGNVPSSTYSQTQNGYDTFVSVGEPLGHEITLRGPCLVSGLSMTPSSPSSPPPPSLLLTPLPSMCRFKTPPCVHSKRPRVSTCINTCGRGAGTHGDVLNVHTEAF